VWCRAIEVQLRRVGGRGIDWGVAGGLVVYIGATWGGVSLMYSHFGDRTISQDTAYFEQVVWGFVSGRNFFMGSSQAWWYYDPPLTSHFAMHFSPVLFLVAGVYALWSSYHVLHLLQIVAIASAALPVYKLSRGIDPIAAALFALAYLLNAAVLSQTQGAFHELALAVPVVAWAVYFFLERRLWPCVLCLVLAIAVREDLALVVCMFSLAAMISRDVERRPRWAWCVLPGLIGVMGWSVAGMVMRSFGNSGDQVILSLFSRFGQSQGEILLNMMLHPGEVIALLLEDHRSRYLIGLLRPGLFASMLSPAFLLALPPLLINLLVRGAGTAWLHAHYTVYLPAILMPAAVSVWLRYAPSFAAWTRSSVQQVMRGVAGLMVVASLVGLPDVFPKEVLEAYVRPPETQEIVAVLAAVPPDAAVAAPRHLLHALGKRTELYMVNRWAAYTRYAPEFIIVERDFSRVELKDGTRTPYAWYAHYLAHDPRFEVVVQQPTLLMYRDRLIGAGSSPMTMGAR